MEFSLLWLVILLMRHPALFVALLSTVMGESCEPGMARKPLYFRLGF